MENHRWYLHVQEMKVVGLGPNVVAYGAAMSALANGKQWELALELLDEVRSRSSVLCLCEVDGVDDVLLP